MMIGDLSSLYDQHRQQQNSEMCKTRARQVQKETEQRHLSMPSLVFRLSSKPFSLRLTIALLKMI